MVLSQSDMIRIGSEVNSAVAESLLIQVPTQIDENDYENSPSNPSTSTKTHFSSKTMSDLLSVGSVLRFTKTMVHT